MATLIDGKAIAAVHLQNVKQRVLALTAAGKTPGLAVILVGDDPASAVYVRNKIKACGEVGIRSTLVQLPATTTQAELLARVRALNDDAAVDGILVQFPLPKHLSEQQVLETISLAKDVDGFHAASVGALLQGRDGLVSCTPLGCMKLLEAAHIPLRGAHAVVVGRSVNVGKPMALLLLAANATVTICHSATRDLAAICRQADVLVAAVGKAGMITADMVKPGATVIDVGINRDAQGKLCGDVDFAAVSQVAGAITPVPGGVGPMTIAMLMLNTVIAAEQHLRAVHPYQTPPKSPLSQPL
jgi:methylenetetrahydrofolate dehydrogenase (NADP+)/methenyltetrahydrofolate cyclohydrolase